MEVLIYYHFFLFLCHVCPRISTSFSLLPVYPAQALEVTKSLPWESMLGEAPSSSDNDWHSTVWFPKKDIVLLFSKCGHKPIRTLPCHFVWDTSEIWRWQRENTARGMTLGSSTNPDPAQILSRPALTSLSLPHRAGAAHPPPPKPLSLQPGNQGQTLAPDVPALLWNFPRLTHSENSCPFLGKRLLPLQDYSLVCGSNKEMVSRPSLVHFLILPLYMVRIKQGKGQLLWWK